MNFLSVLSSGYCSNSSFDNLFVFVQAMQTIHVNCGREKLTTTLQAKVVALLSSLVAIRPDAVWSKKEHNKCSKNGLQREECNFNIIIMLLTDTILIKIIHLLFKQLVRRISPNAGAAASEEIPLRHSVFRFLLCEHQEVKAMASSEGIFAVFACCYRSLKDKRADFQVLHR